MCELQLTCKWCEACKRSVQGTPAPPWWDAHAGRGTASHGAAQERDSSEEPRVPEKCQSSTGLQCRKRERVGITWEVKEREMMPSEPQWSCAQRHPVPVTGLSRRRTEDGLLMSAKNLYRSSSLSLSPSYRTTGKLAVITTHIQLHTSPWVVLVLKTWACHYTQLNRDSANVRKTDL